METHFLSSSDNWSCFYADKSLWAGFRGHSAGMGILFRKGESICVRRVLSDLNGRFLIASIVLNRISLALINVYCPDRPSARSLFLQDFCNSVLSFPL